MSEQGDRPEVPQPAHPQIRKEPLPWQAPKPLRDDPEGLRKVRAIMDSPSYRLAVEDPVFQQRDDTRGIRLQLDYLKPERFLVEHGIFHTIVVFGSTRIVEPKAAGARVAELLQALDQTPDDAALMHRFRVAERILANSRYYEVAREFSRIVGESGGGPKDSRLVVMTGGGPGMMEAANRGAHDAGAESVGLNIDLPHEQYPNPYITPGLCFRFHYFALRKLHFMRRARALVAFPGGFGTMDELFETLTLIQTRKIKPVPVILVGRSFWERAIDFDFLVAEGVIDAEDRELFWYAESARDIWDGLVCWYRCNGEELIEGYDGPLTCPEEV
ncbi:MAG: cytochrome D ubiquinol oxidase subunit II [Gammaproteobacteria bacterium]|nr:cytochrome D ubiquinol oxidase subunit II [Gammaproteobacteria bacterium]